MEDSQIMEYVLFFIVAFACGFIYSYDPVAIEPVRTPSFKLTAADCKAKM